MASVSDLRSVLACTPKDPRFSDFLAAQLGISDALSQVAPKAFSDCVYFSWPSSGVSFVFDCVAPYKPRTGPTSLAELQLDSLRLSAIDLYHQAPPDASSPPSKGRSKAKTTSSSSTTVFSTCAKVLPLSFDGSSLSLSTETTAKDMVEALGEPDAKGGGSVVPIWLEWVCSSSPLYRHLIILTC